MRFLTLAAFAGLLMFACFTSESSAQKNAKKNAKGAVNSAHVINELENVRNLLNKANHDYKGHRAAGVHQVTHAIHMLQHGKQHPNPSQHFVAGKGGNEPQSVSDAQLQKAIAHLNTILAQVQGSQIQHHAAVAGHITKAINDLQAALKVA